LDAREHQATIGSGRLLAHYFETVGDRGVVTRGGGDAPVARVLAEIAALRDGTLVASSSNAPLAVQTLAIRAGATIVVLVANLSSAPRRVLVSGGPEAHLRPWDVSRLESTERGWTARSIE
jgi:hypothetical protein